MYPSGGSGKTKPIKANFQIPQARRGSGKFKGRESGTTGAFLNGASGRRPVGERGPPGVGMPPGQGKTAIFEKMLVLGI